MTALIAVVGSYGRCVAACGAGVVNGFRDECVPDSRHHGAPDCMRAAATDAYYRTSRPALRAFRRVTAVGTITTRGRTVHALRYAVLRGIDAVSVRTSADVRIHNRGFVTRF